MTREVPEVPVTGASDDLLREQIDYYRARAGEYDDWWYRRGRYDRGPEINQQWFAEAAQVRDTLHALGRFAHTLELACGTGLWTEELARLSARVTALDASAEVLEINRRRVKEGQVEYRQVDLFAWESETAYDLVFAAFWFSHVPPQCLDAFLDRVSRATRAGGHVFIVDSLYDSASTAHDHTLLAKEQHWQRRRLDDGREFRVVKVFHDPPEMARRLTQHGFEVQHHGQGRFFFWLAAQRV